MTKKTILSVTVSLLLSLVIICNAGYIVQSDQQDQNDPSCIVSPHLIYPPQKAIN